MTAFQVTTARYAKGQMVVSCPSSTGYKTRAAYLCEALGGRWVNRSRGYHLSPTGVEKLKVLHAAGFDAVARIFRDSPVKLIRPGEPDRTLRDALAIAKAEASR